MPNTSGRPSRPSSSSSRRPFSSSSSSRTGASRPYSASRDSAPRSSGGYSRGGSSRSFGGGSRGFGNRGGSGGRGRGARVMSTFDVSKFINLNPAKAAAEAPYVAKHTFNDFGLDKSLSDVVAEIGLVTPSAIQDQVIPYILDGHDVVGLAQTGTGKTAAFLLPVIQKTLHERGRMTLILTPTRELAIQVEQELRKLTPRMNIYSTVCVGGMNIRPQISGLRRKNHFIIGTPGRVQDLMDRGHIKPGGITTVIFDEADRMLDMGFIHDMRKILENVTKNRQTLFFSATMTDEAQRLVNDFMRSPETVSVKKKDVTNSIAQDVVVYEHAHKFDTLLKLLENDELKRVIIFGAMKHSVEKLSNELSHNGIKSDSIHGNKSHGQRQRALGAFKSGNVRVLVATDVAARGIHVDNVSHVINYDLPGTFEDYVHRIGRTGRGVHKGQALTFVAKR